MGKKRISGYIAGGVVVLIGLFTIISYNGLVKKEEEVKNRWVEMQNAYQRRLDLVPNLVNVVKGVSDFEQTTLQKIAEARNNALTKNQSGNISAENYEEQKRIQDSLAINTNRLIISIEKYPTLKGTSAYAGLQTQLEGTERRIVIARKDFNAAIADYNNAARNFPSGLTAKVFGFKIREGFQSDTGSEKTVQIKF
jgi:LemA protein